MLTIDVMPSYVTFAHVHRYEIIIMRMCGCPRICCETSTAHVVEDEFYVVNLISSHVLANGKT